MPSAVSRRYAALLGFLAMTFLAAAIGSWATFQGVRDWYPTLAKPTWTPPSAVFSPVWTVLYALMAIAGWRAWLKASGPSTRGILALYVAQLAANALWSVLFFGFRRPDLALVEIVMLWALLVFCAVRFTRVDRLAGVLWAPYVAWVTFAAGLNAAVWRMNS